MTPETHGDNMVGAVLDAVPFLVTGLAVAPLLLLVPNSGTPTVRLITHLAALVALGLILAFRLAPRLDQPFFAHRGWAPRRESIGTGIALVVVVTGVVGLVTLASAAALRFDPSLQFLQLLSALDIAWAGAAMVVGARHLWGRTASVVSGVVLGAVCVASIWNYVRIVGYTSDGGWLVDGSRLMTLVIPLDTLAAIVAGAVLLGAAVRVSANRAGQ
ncbi:MAG: hypothetical protein ACE5GC_10580 [Acidimicrobiia bacterium]